MGPVVFADYQLELQLLRYLNPTHRLQSERCCDMGQGVRECVNNCDNSFDFCLSRPGRANCSLGQLTTGLLHSPDPDMRDSIYFSTDGGLIADHVQNPLVFTGVEWPVSLEKSSGKSITAWLSFSLRIGRV